VDIGDVGVAVDVAVLERHPFARSHPGRRGEEHHCREAQLKPLGDRLNLVPGFERALLCTPPLRVLDSLLGRVDVEHLP
jgi:hypothetical protein